jgi:deoxyribodipyrimidine photo-lyase
MLGGQIGKKNLTFKEKFNHIKWKYDEEIFQRWCDGKTGIPVCDSGVIQMNTTGFLHNRLRMVVASTACKLLSIPWWKAEQYFAQKLLDYDVIQNSAGWNWTIGGIDPKQILRIFSPKSQSEKFDSDTTFIKRWIPELKDVPSKDIHDWENSYDKHLKNGVKYYKPIIDYKQARSEMIKELNRVNKLKN